MSVQFNTQNLLRKKSELKKSPKFSKNIFQTAKNIDITIQSVRGLHKHAFFVQIVHF